MNDLPIFLFIYVDAPLTIGKSYIGSYEVLHGYILALLSGTDITMKFVSTHKMSALESVSFVAGVPGCGSNIMHLLLD